MLKGNHLLVALGCKAQRTKTRRFSSRSEEGDRWHGCKLRGGYYTRKPSLYVKNVEDAHTDATCFPRWTNSSPLRELKGLFCSLNFRPDPSEGQSLLKNRPLMREWTKFMWRTWTDFICTIHKKLAIFCDHLKTCAATLLDWQALPLFLWKHSFVGERMRWKEKPRRCPALWILFASKQLKPIAINWRTISNFLFDEN